MIYTLGCRKDPVDLRDIPMGLVLPAIPVPLRIDYTPLMSPVRDQGDEGTCHSEDTEILTIDGWKFFSEVTNRDNLATINPDTFKLEYQKPLKLHKYEFAGDLYHCTNIHLDFAITPEHRMFVRKFDNVKKIMSDKFGFVRVMNLGWYSGLLSSPSGFDGKFIKNIKIGDKDIAGDDLLKFFGIFLSDGWLRKRKTSKYGYVTGVCCFKNEYYDTIYKLLKSLPFGFHEQSGRTGYFTSSDKHLYHYLEPYAINGALNKYVPDFIKNAPSSQIQLFLDFFCFGDGHKTQDGRIWYYTSSKRMANDLQEMVLKTGKNSSIIVRPVKDRLIFKKRVIKATKCHEAYVVSVWRTPHLSIDRKKQMRVKHYKGMVYCASVSNSLLLTRRNGKILISGNCVAFASVVGVKEYEDAKEYKRLIALAPRYVYSLCKQNDGAPDEEGTYPRVAMKMLLKFGVCPESMWPYEPHQTNDHKKGADAKAKVYRIKAYARLESVQEMKRSLLVNGPFLAGVRVYESWFSKSVEKTGLIPLPKKGEDIAGGHAICIVGYDDEKGLFKFKNSWSAKWAQKGYGFLPYAYMQRYCSDAWSATDLIENPEFIVAQRQKVLKSYV
jgi:hypothetical protein